ncbi:MAG: hypothetical protein QW247_07470 [Pyrobaculum sp.]
MLEYEARAKSAALRASAVLTSGNPAKVLGEAEDAVGAVEAVGGLSPWRAGDG